MRRAFPVVFSRYAVRPVDNYGTVLLRALRHHGTAITQARLRIQPVLPSGRGASVWSQ